MKRLLLPLIFCYLLQPAMGQISGQLMGADGIPVPYATVLLLNERDSAMVGSAMTNESGAYTIESVKPGSYKMKFSSIGYVTVFSDRLELTVSSAPTPEKATQDQSLVTKDLGVQILTPDSNQLSEVVIEGERPFLEQRTDGLVVNVEASLMTKGSTVLQLLERSPGVRIDLQNNTMELNGKNGVMVMMNGKLLRVPVEQLVGMLGGMSGNNIERIELLTTPPAGFDAEGSGGIINIVTKKTIDLGTTGSISLTGGYGYKEKGVAGITLNHLTDKTELYSSYTFSHDRNSAYFYAVGHEQEPFLGGRAASDFTSVSRVNQDSHNATLGFDTRLNSKTKIGGNTNYSNSQSLVRMTNTGIYEIENDSIYLLHATANNANRWRSSINNFYIEREFKAEEKLSLDLDYLHYNNDYPTDGENSFLSVNGYQAGNNDTLFSPVSSGLSKTFIKVGVAKIDYSKPLIKGWKLETGLKGTLTRSTSSSAIRNLVDGEYITRPASVNNLTMKEDIGAAYASLEGSIDTSIHIVAGLRYEYSHTEINNAINGSSIADRRLGKFFPNITISREFNQRSGFYISYTKRISRPTYNDLASFVTPNGPTSVNTGNPLLKPTLTNNIKLGYHHSGYTFSILLSRDDHPISRSQIVATRDMKQMAVSPQNLIYQNNLTFQATIPIVMNSWWSMNYGFIGGWRKFKLDYTKLPTERTYFAYTLQSAQTFRLAYGFAVEASGYFNSNGYNGSRTTVGYGVVNAGIKKEFKKGGTLQLSLTDIFQTGAFRSYFGKLTTEAFDLQTYVVYHPEASLYHTIRLTYTKSFGTGHQRQTKQNGVDQTERERIGN